MQFYYVKPLKLEISYRTSVTLSWWFSNLFSFSAHRKLFFRPFFSLITASVLNFNTIDIIYICLLTICICHCALQSKIHLLPNPEPIFVPLGALLPWLRTHAINDSKMCLLFISLTSNFPPVPAYWSFILAFFQFLEHTKLFWTLRTFFLASFFSPWKLNFRMHCCLPLIFHNIS